MVDKLSSQAMFRIFRNLYKIPSVEDQLTNDNNVVMRGAKIAADNEPDFNAPEENYGEICGPLGAK